MDTQAWVSWQCVCGFRLARLPRDVLEDLPRCLGCGRDLRRGAPRADAPPAAPDAPKAPDAGPDARGLKTQGLGDVRDLR